MFRLAIAFLLLFSLPAAAGTPQERHKWWQGDQAKELGLTREQSDKLEGIYQQVFPRIQSASQDADAAQKELNRIISGDRTTEVDVVRQLNYVQVQRDEMNRQFVLMLFRMNRELTPEQRAKVRAMFDRREQERREGRRGQPQARPPIKK
jgi:Spy/CpxP family protein refolding chaperone